MLNAVTNLGRADRVLRTYITLALFAGVLAGYLAPVYALVGVPIGLTAIVAWDPFYALFNINSIGHQEIRENGLWEPNMGQSDRAIRLSVAMTSLVLGMLATEGSMTIGMSLMFLVPVLLMATAITAWDPMYALVKKVRPEVQEDIINFKKLAISNVGEALPSQSRKAA